MRVTTKIERVPIKIDESIRRKTYSTIFLLPCLGLDKNILDKFGFVNAYIGDKGWVVDYAKSNPVYLLFEHELDEEFDDFINELSKNKLYIDDYDAGFKQVMVVFRFPTEWKKEYKLFKVGKYSEFNRKYVDEFFPMTRKEVKEGVVKTVATVFSGIFNKEEWLKEYWERKLGTEILPSEYWSIPEDKKEVFRYGGS